MNKNIICLDSIRFKKKVIKAYSTLDIDQMKIVLERYSKSSKRRHKLSLRLINEKHKLFKPKKDIKRRLDQMDKLYYELDEELDWINLGINLRDGV